MEKKSRGTGEEMTAFSTESSKEAGSRRADENSSQDHSFRRLNPLGMRVVMRIIKDRNKTKSGLYLPEGARERTNESILGEVLEVAIAQDEDIDDEEINISGIPLGAMILIPADAGIKVPWDDDLRIVDTADVLATVFEVSVS